MAGSGMIEQDVMIDGRRAKSVAYIMNDFTPATKETADMAKVIFENGDIAFLNMKEKKAEL